jgi:hypothetical protein
MEDGKSVIGTIFRVFYTDDTINQNTGLPNKREKVLRLDSSDDTFYFFFNMQTKKKEAIPKRVIDRMEEYHDKGEFR